MRYLVKWEIDIDADSPVAAAKEALECQRDPGSIAVYFTVTNIETQETTDIDLMDEEEG